MKEDLLKIIKKYGIDNQQKKFALECQELQKQITIHEMLLSNEYEIPLLSIMTSEDDLVDRIADNIILLLQFKEYYDISDEIIKEKIKFKVKTQLKHMECGE